MKISPTTPCAMLQYLRYLLTALYLLLISTAAQGQDNLSAFVDRTDVSVNDVLTLTIRVGATLGSNRPSLDGLEEDFELLGTTTSSSFSNINGNVQSWTEYRVSLKPKDTGTLTIPAFRIMGEATRPITVNVSEGTPVSGASNEDIFLTTSVSKNEVYVQEQLVFTVKLYYSLRFNQGAQLSTPQVENSVVQQLGSDQNYQEIVEGIRYDVTERRYVIFPQSSGDLVIPPVYFSATVGGRNGLNRLLNRSSPTRQVELSGDTHPISVRPIPDSFTGNTWLPASNLELRENWSGDSDTIEVGDSLTREIRLVAEGLSSSLLPDLEHPGVDGIRFYPDQPEREDSADSDGVVGSRTESVAIVPARAGTFELPPIRVAWWNTEEDREEVAQVPSRTITVSGGAPADTATTPATSTISDNAAAGNGTTASSPTTDSGNPTPWIITTALLALALIFSTFLWLRARSGQTLPAVPSGMAAEASTSPPPPDLDKSFKYFVRSCERDSPEDIRRAILSWGQAFYGNRNIRTLDQLKAYIQNPTVDALLYNLERTLYRPGGDEEKFRSMQLLKEITALHRQGRKRNNEPGDNALPPLYRN